ncbi:MAG: cold shock domain-containing protein [Verrucomicrobiales bacterium]|nr:cold shock domain-containing protein [Verrucomicrobiae bacterium]
MGRSQETFSKKEVRNKKEKKRKDKEAKMQARRENADPGNAQTTIAYVDENGNLTTTPPDPNQKKKEIDLDSMEIGTPKRDDSRGGNTDRKGVVTFFNDSKGYGFIKDADTQESIFVHVNNVAGEISEGTKVTFEIAMGPKGPAATQVRIEES